LVFDETDLYLALFKIRALEKNMLLHIFGCPINDYILIISVAIVFLAGLPHLDKLES